MKESVADRWRVTAKNSGEIVGIEKKKILEVGKEMFGKLHAKARKRALASIRLV